MTTFTASLLLGVFVHLDLPFSRRTAKSTFTQWFNEFFHGTVQIEQVQRLDTGGVSLASIDILDPEGRTTLHISELEIEAHLPSLLIQSLLANDPSITINDVLISHPSLHLHQTTNLDEQGQRLNYFSIADAFSPRIPSDESTSSSGIRVELSQVRLVRLAAQGTILERQLEGHVRAAVASVVATERGVRVDVEKFGLQAKLPEGVNVLALGELNIRAPGTIAGEVLGQIGTIPFSQSFAVSEDEIEVRGEFPRVTASDLKPFWPNAFLDGTISVKNRFQGTLPHLDTRIDIQSGHGSVHAEGRLTTSPDLEADLDIDTHELDLSTLNAAWPASSLNLRSSAEMQLSEERINLELDATLAESTLGGAVLPVIDAHSSYDDRGLSAEATLREQGLPIHLELEGNPPEQLAFELELRKTALQKSPRLRRLFDAEGTVRGMVNGHVNSGQVDVNLSFEGNSVKYGSLQAQSVNVNGHAHTNLKHPAMVEADLHAQIDTM